MFFCLQPKLFSEKQRYIEVVTEGSNKEFSYLRIKESHRKFIICNRIKLET